MKEWGRKENETVCSSGLREKRTCRNKKATGKEMEGGVNLEVLANMQFSN
jgi:hypothetical protein